LRGRVTTLIAESGAQIRYAYDGSLVTEIETTGGGGGVLSWTYDNDMRRATSTFWDDEAGGLVDFCLYVCDDGYRYWDRC